MEVPNLLPLSVLIICVHVSPPKNSHATKLGISSKTSLFYFPILLSKRARQTINRWLDPQKQHLTDDQVQPRTSRKITEQLQMAMTVTHPPLHCPFHPHSLLNPSSPQLPPLFPISLMTLTIRSGITRDSCSSFNEV